MRVIMSVKFIEILLVFCYFTSFWPTYASHPEADKSVCIYHDTKFTCDCGYSNEPTELPALEGNVIHISIANCKIISIVTNFLSSTFGLRSISFTNIENLTLKQNALRFPQLLSSTRLIIEFNNVTAREIQSHVFNGNIDEITFVSSRIEMLRPFAFTAFRDKAYSIKFIGTVFNVIEPQAFKKFSVDQLEIADSVFLTTLPTRAFYDVDVKDFFKVYNSSFNGAFSRAFSFSSLSMLSFTGNQFNKFDGECFEIKIVENVIIRNNTFTSIHPALFREIHVSPEALARSEKVEFRLLDNIIQQPSSPIPLYLSDSFQIVLRKLYFAESVNCDKMHELAANSFFTAYEDFIYLKLGENVEYETFNQALHTSCKHNPHWLYIAIGLGCLLLLAIITALFAVYIIRKRRKNKLEVIMPEARTYRETQIVLQIENAGLLKTDM